MQDEPLLQGRLDELAKMSESCQSRPSKELATALCANSRDIWRAIWMDWIRRHDDSTLERFSQLVPCFEAARLAAREYDETVDSSQLAIKRFSSHLVTNISWRLDMARILTNLTLPQEDREASVIQLQDSVFQSK